MDSRPCCWLQLWSPGHARPRAYKANSHSGKIEGRQDFISTTVSASRGVVLLFTTGRSLSSSMNRTGITTFSTRLFVRLIVQINESLSLHQSRAGVGGAGVAIRSSIVAGDAQQRSVRRYAPIDGHCAVGQSASAGALGVLERNSRGFYAPYRLRRRLRRVPIDHIRPEQKPETGTCSP